MNLSQLKDEEKMFLSRLGDLFSISREKYITRFSHFMDERQGMIAREYARQNQLANYLLFGGREGAARMVLGVFAPHEEPCENAFPIEAVTALYSADAALTHRDFLGSLMALQIKRESVGDILISPGRCVFYALRPVAQTILDELLKVGNCGVRCERGVPGDFVVLERFETIRGTLHSARIDSLVAILTKSSREKASLLIRERRVLRNWAEVENGSREFFAGDTFSIRGVGRFIVDEIALPTKKGRLPVICRKYL